MAEDISVGLAFDIDQADLDSAFTRYMGEITSQLSESLSAAQELHRAMSSLVDPVKNLVKEADKFRDAMQEVKDLAAAVRRDLGGLSMPGGGGMGGMFGGGGGGGALGALAQLAGAGGGLGALAMGSAGVGAMLGSGLIGGSQVRSVGTQVADAVGSIFGTRARTRVFQFMEEHGIMGAQEAVARANRQEYNPREALREMTSRGIGGIYEAYRAGYRPDEILSSVSNRDLAYTAGAGVGLLRGISGGGGLVGMFSQMAGTALGARGGYDVAGAPGALIGGQFFPGFLQQNIQQGMSMYPGFLQTMASMASVGMYGGSLRQVRGVAPGRFGYGPSEIGPEFSQLYQGFGGGELTSDTLRTAMAYSRAYGVNMGAIGQSIGGLINIGGGGQAATGAQREEIMARVMADAVAEGFGRRLPEFSQAVGTGVQSAMSGPGLITQAAMPGLISTMSRMTGLMATRHGVGLQGAQRLLSPITSVPQGILEGFSGEGDPYRMAMYWGTNREAFGHDPMQLLRAAAKATNEPLGEMAMQLQRGSLEQIFRNTPGGTIGQYNAIMRMFPGMTAQGALGIMERGGAAFEAAGGTLEGVDIQEILTGVTEEQRDEGAETRDTLRSIQESGEQIMNEQLGELRRLSNFQEQQLSIAAAHAPIAERFYNVQMAYSRVGAQMIASSSVMQMLQSAETVFSPEFAERLRRASNADRLQMGMERVVRAFTEGAWDDPERMAAVLSSTTSSGGGSGGQRRSTSRSRIRAAADPGGGPNALVESALRMAEGQSHEAQFSVQINQTRQTVGGVGNR